MAIINAIVEGQLDEVVAIRLISESGHTPGATYGKRGSGYIRNKISGFNRSAIGIAYLALTDLMDTGLGCSPLVVQTWVPHRNHGMLFRVIVQELESWLLADSEGIADYLGIRRNRIPTHPELIPNPKLALINLARLSRRKTIRNALIPQPGSTAQTGKLYLSEMSAFAQNKWSIANARVNSSSLDRCLQRLFAFH